MARHTQYSDRCHALRMFRSRLIPTALVAGLALAGCGHEHVDVPKAEIKTVEAYGVTLGPEASPQQVVHVLLKSIADDYAAAGAKDAAAQKKAQELTYSLAAVDEIERRLIDAAKQLNPQSKKEDLGDERDAKIFKAVHYWAPIVGHYVPSFASMDMETFVRESWVAVATNGKAAQVFLPVAHDPAETDPAKAQTATIEVELVRETAQSGGSEYWRVVRVNFLGRRFRAPSAAQVVQAYGLTLDESAGPAQVAGVVLRSLAEMVDAADKPGRQDLRASAMYRVFCLADTARVLAASRTPEASEERGDVLTVSVANAVSQWAQEIQPAVEAIKDPSKVAPEQMQVRMAGDAAAQVTFNPPQADYPILIEMVQDQAAGKSFWRVVKVVGGAGAADRPAPQPTGAQ